MPSLLIELLAGRSDTEKRELMHEVAIATSRVLDVPMGRVRIRLHEYTPDHWSVGGRRPMDLAISELSEEAEGSAE